MNASVQPDATEARAGFIATFCAFLCWGVLPLYLKLIAFADVREVLGVRILMSVPAALIAVFVLSGWRQGWRELATAFRPRMLATLSASAVFIFANWGLYVLLVLDHRVLEAALAYFLTPLVMVAVGVAFFGESVGRVQIAALTFAALGVIVQAFAIGAPPWMALAVCASFSAYALIRKRAPVQAGAGLLVETVVLIPVALGLLLWAGSHAPLAFGQSFGSTGILALAGPVTALPLMLFAFGARRVSFMTLGLLQYLAPTLQFLTGIAFGEPLSLLRAASFALIWVGLALYSWDALRRARAA